MQSNRFFRACSVAFILMSASCSGGGGSGQPAPVSFGAYDEAGYADRCANPRVGTDPSTNQPYPDVAGSYTDENNWLRSWSNDKYLWYTEIIDADPAVYSTPKYFDLMKTFAVMPSGKAKDRFHFTMPTGDWWNFSQTATITGYGAEWAVLSPVPPRKAIVAYTHPGTPATGAAVNLVRGEEILKVDGIDIVNTNNNADIAAINSAMWPAATGQTHTFVVRNPTTAMTRTITMTSASITQTPVQNVSTIATASGNVGYILFLDHVASSEQTLINAINQLKAANITDLVLDLRYNGGGYLDIASELAYMIAGPAATAGKTFEKQKFNNKHPTINPVTGLSISPIPFHSASLGFSAAVNQALPSLDLPRLFVLTGENTCSASETIINSLSGINIPVIQIGSTTCGKPYGFYPTDNCGTTYFSISFKGVNAKGFGDYIDGFTPSNSISGNGVKVTGCSVADDFTKPLGDATEARLAAALGYINTSTCPAPAATGFVAGAVTGSKSPADAQLNKPVWLQNRILK